MKFHSASFWGALGGAFLLACSSNGASFVEAYNEQEAAAFMERFNIPKNHIPLEWASTGSDIRVTEVGGVKYKWKPKEGSVGAKVGYAQLWDRSARSYCTRFDARVDTQRYLGQRLMAVGACPNYGKYIAFVDKNGEPADSIERFTDEIHENAMPFTTKGCSSTAKLGDEEVPMEQSGWAMYSGYMVRCPYNETVYTQDLLQDGEFDREACSFVTNENPLIFLDTSAKEGSLAYTAYAFHGRGGHKGYDFVGDGIGCPAYKPPRTTRSMKTPDIANDPFRCSQLSRCTSLCWPWDKNRPCFRSLPASFDHKKNECLILGRHTQTYISSTCAVRKTSDPDAKYCVKASKSIASSYLTYVTAFTRPDYQTACPPRGALKDVIFGKKSGNVCMPLPAVRTLPVPAGFCGVTVFEASGDDTPATLGGTGKSAVNWASWIPNNAQTDGICRLHETVPDCLVKTQGAFAFTALTAADISLAETVPENVIMPGPCESKKCQNGGTCDMFTGECSCTTCYSGSSCETKIHGCCETSKDCNNGTCGTDSRCQCLPGFVGDACDTSKCSLVHCLNGGTCKLPDGTCECPKGYYGPRCESSVCDGVKCQNGGRCSLETSVCECPACFLGDNCEIKNPKCCSSDADCHAPHGSCQNNLCICEPGITGDTCTNGGCRDTVCLNGGSCQESSVSCICPKCTQGSYCELIVKNCCESDSDCNPPNGTCNTVNGQCQCKEGFFGSNCTDLCADKNCSGHGTCEPETGYCLCSPGWKGAACDEEDDTFCKGVTCGENQTCDNADGSCICKPGYTGVGCVEKDERCSDICQHSAWMVSNQDSSDEGEAECTADCYSMCCKHVLEDCHEEQNAEEIESCVRHMMEADEDEQCCVVSEGLSPIPYIAAAAAIVLVLLLAAGVSEYSRRQKPGEGPGGDELPSEDVTGGRRRSSRKDSAISVDFEDYASNPDDEGDVSVLMDEDGEGAHEANWDEGDY